ncbi:MAG: helix-turn-helix transcriptional regulator, partial [Crenarchaeota archaeon]|nr:helix-turn-helix transcriptional regulator [Thermoproteota archaeon]
KKLLKANQMNQVDLAQQINISESKMSKILNGSLEPNLTDLKLISKVLNVTIDEIVNGETTQNMTLIEKAIIEGYESFTNLINNDHDWIYRIDDKGCNIFYYLKKHDSYDYLIYFYENKYNNVLSVVQKYYAQMIHSLIEKKLFEKYLEIDSFKFRWDLSEIDPQGKFSLNNIDSNRVIYEVISNSNEKSKFYKKEYENKIGKIELQQYTIYIYKKEEFRIICDELLLSQNADPKFIINAEKRKDYIKKYYANNKEILNEKIELIKTTNIYDDVENVNEALFLTGDKSSIIELATLQINQFQKVDFKNLQDTNNESNYLGKIAQFNKKVERIKHYLILCIKYNNIELFKNIISIPKLEDIITNVKEERTNFTDYGINKIRNNFFNFEMPFSFKKEVLEVYPNLIDEIKFDYQEIIKSEQIADYKYAIDKLDIYYYKLPFYADLEIKLLLSR